LPGFQYPVVSGNVSFYNETEGRGILPTPVIGMLGLIEDVKRVVQPASKTRVILLRCSAPLAMIFR